MTARSPGRPRATCQAAGSPPGPPSPLVSSITAPSERRATAISSVSLARSGLVITVGPAASAARTSARLVIDFEPGGRSRAHTGPAAAGAVQSGCMLRAYWPSPPPAIHGSVNRLARRGLANPDAGY